MPRAAKRPATWNYSDAAKRAYKKRYASKKVSRRRTVTRSKIGSLNTHRFCRHCASITLPAVALSAELDAAVSFTIGDIVNPGEFTALFDRYRIDKIIYKIQLMNNPDTGSYLANPVANNNNNFYPKIWWCKDYDDAAPENITAMQQRVGVRCAVMQPNKIHTMVVRPAILNQTYRTALTAGYAPKFGQFIDMGNTDVPHYGLKYCLDFNGFATVAASLWQFRIDKKYYFTCKDVR